MLTCLPRRVDLSLRSFNRTRTFPGQLLLEEVRAFRDQDSHPKVYPERFPSPYAENCPYTTLRIFKRVPPKTQGYNLQGLRYTPRIVTDLQDLQEWGLGFRVLGFGVGGLGLKIISCHNKDSLFCAVSRGMLPNPHPVL